MSLSIESASALPVDLCNWPQVASLGEHFRDRVLSFTLAHDWFYFIMDDDTVWRSWAAQPKDVHDNLVSDMDGEDDDENDASQQSPVEMAGLQGKAVWKIQPDSKNATFALDRAGRLWSWVVVMNREAILTSVVQQIFLPIAANANLVAVADFFVEESLLALTKDREIYVSSSTNPEVFVRLEIANVQAISCWPYGFIMATSSHDQSVIRIWNEHSLDSILPLSLRTFTLCPVRQILTHQLHDFVLVDDGSLLVFTNHRHLVPFEHEFSECPIRTIFTNLSKIFVQFEDDRIFQIVTVVGQNRKLYPVPNVRCISDLWAAAFSERNAHSIKAMLTLRMNREHLPMNMRFGPLDGAYSVYQFMRSMFNNPERSDLRVCFDGHPIIYVHRNLLQFFSDYWLTRLASPWDNKAEIFPKEYGFQVFYLYFKFLYTRHISWMSYPNILDLIDLGKSYFETDLLDYCVDFLVTHHLNRNTSLYLYRLGELYELEKLCSAAAHCIRQNWAFIDMDALQDMGDDGRMNLMIAILTRTMDHI